MENMDDNKVLNRYLPKLPADIIFLVAKRIKLVRDFFAFRAVCPSWRSASNFYGTGRFPLLKITPGTYSGELQDQFLNPWTGKRKVVPSSWCYLGCSGGWVLKFKFGTGRIQLRHIFAQTRIELPYLEAKVTPAFRKGVVSSNPLTTTDYTLAILYDDNKTIAFWRSGDESFNISTQWTTYRDAIFYKGSFYVINSNFDIVRFDLMGQNHLSLGEIITKIPCSREPRPFLVESDGELLVVLISFFGKDLCRVFRLQSNSLIEMFEGIGDKALFLGKHSSSSSRDASEIPGCKANHIYFCSPNRMKVVSIRIEDSKIESYWTGEEHKLLLHRPIWVEPTLLDYL